MNQERLNKVQGYLSDLSIDVKDKRYSMNFCKKNEYIQSIMQQAIQETQTHMSFGYGNVNSNICFVVNDETMFNDIKPLVQEVLDKFDINFWDIYVTFIYKTSKVYNRCINLLMNEINAVSPKIIYVFDKDEKALNALLNEFTKYGVTPPKYYYVNIDKLSEKTVEVKRELWKMFRYLINYKEITVKK